jgi:hypothetical protein
MSLSKSSPSCQKWRLIASISLVSGTLGVAYWLYKNRRYAEEKPEIREERFKLVEEFSEITQSNPLRNILRMILNFL